MTINYRVSLLFTKLPDAALDDYAANIVVSMTGNPSYLTPLVALAALSTVREDFHDALIAAAQGGTQLTAVKNEARAALENLLRQEASYVQAIAGQNLAVLLSSGFTATSTNRASTQLPPPASVNLSNGLSTQLVLRMKPVPNARAYEVQTKNGAGWTAAGIFPKARPITLPGLTPGQIYSVQARAIGGSTGYSDWSDPSSHMVT